jgi:hypothetical protein
MSIKIEPSLEGATIIAQPMVRNFSTGGGHGPSDTLIEGDGKIVTKKWQGFRRSISKSSASRRHRCARTALPRHGGIRNPHSPSVCCTQKPAQPLSRAAIRRLDTTAAEKMRCITS